MAKTDSLQFEDIQGFALRGFGQLAHSGYSFVRLESLIEFKHWLAQALHSRQITPATVRKVEAGQRLCIAFSASGLRKLLGNGFLQASFAPEFIEGMVQEHRSRLLGDLQGNDPEHWRWGRDDGIDAMLMLFANDQDQAAEGLDSLVTADHGMAECQRIYAQVPADGKEPFGFADGISQPILQGTDRDSFVATNNNREHKLHSLAAGEFILGYKDGSGSLPSSPGVSPALDKAGTLAAHPQRPELRDLGRNGSYLVVRQLAQDVDGFHQYVSQQQQQGLDFNVAAKMVGRHQDGRPLVQGGFAQHDNDFDYTEDIKGISCPIGSHVRRTNPRSVVHDATEAGALDVSKRHRIIRRGRVYNNGDGETGLLFLCLNASINRQFEFVQSAWSNDPFFQGLSGEVDPILGTQRQAANGFTVPQRPYRSMLNDLPQWVTVKGGGYFFLPGMSALGVLSH